MKGLKVNVLFFLILFFSLFSCFSVDAKVSDVSIKNVEQVEKNGMIEKIDDASFNGMNINFNLVFHTVNDSVKYRVTIQNNGSDDVYISNKGSIENSSFISYDYLWDNNDNVIKGNG